MEEAFLPTYIAHWFMLMTRYCSLKSDRYCLWINSINAASGRLSKNSFFRTFSPKQQTPPHPPHGIRTFWKIGSFSSSPKYEEQIICIFIIRIEANYVCSSCPRRCSQCLCSLLLLSSLIPLSSLHQKFTSKMAHVTVLWRQPFQFSR